MTQLQPEEQALNDKKNREDFVEEEESSQTSESLRQPCYPEKKPKETSTVLSNFFDLFTQKWTRKSPNKLYLLLYNLISPFTVIFVAGIVAYVSSLPFIFPSLGPTAFLQFAVPNKPPASPKYTLTGHFIGIVMGFISLQITDLYNNEAIFIEGASVNRILAASLSVGLTCFFMILFRVEHPPAGATTLIVSLGILKTPIQLSCMLAAVLLITILSFIINRLFRKDVLFPMWSVPKNSQIETEDSLKHASERFDGLGLSRMNLSDMNINLRKLSEMNNKLTIDNFVEYFHIVNEMQIDKSMKLLITFARDNTQRLKTVHGYKSIPYSTRHFLESVSYDHDTCALKRHDTL